MAVSKRLRYEILRRDDHRCRYCGAGPEEGPLTVDHVVPVALGGSDEPSNLVAACRDCNAGKSASAPDAPIVAGVADDALRWAAAMRRAGEILTADRRAMEEMQDSFAAAWGSYYSLPSDWRSNVTQFLEAGATMELLYDCIDIAFAARGVDWRWKYFCGVTWRRLREQQQVASELIDRGDL